MPKQILLGLLAVAMVVLPARPAYPAAEDDLSPELVRQAIEQGVAYLRGKQHDGKWDDYPNGGQTGGVTALCTLALLNCGVPVSDPQIQSALNAIRNQPLTERTYVVSLQTMVLCLAEPNRDLLKIQENAAWLQKHQLVEGEKRGGWAYPNIGLGDLSNSQFALLALSEAERVGVPVKQEVWSSAIRYWKSAQNDDGSWGYFSQQGSGSMTCAGISSLVIASGHLSQSDATADGDTVRCCGSQDQEDDSAKAIDRALRWLGRRDVFTVQENPYESFDPQTRLRTHDGPPWHFYYLYGLERIGRLTARRFIGDHDWYREGAAYLCRSDVRKLGKDGYYWEGTQPRDAEADPTIATSFALLFLGKGRRPILISKLQHGPGDDWNHHRSDVANLTTYVEGRWQKDFPLGMSWQVIDLNKATVEDLKQSPVLFINGSQVPEIDDEQGKMLREYIDRGGFIFAEACCPDSDNFDRGFRTLMKRVFPPEYQLRVLPPEHPIWKAEEILPAGKQRTLLGIDYGCRTSVVYCPPPAAGDPRNGLSCYWELSTRRKRGDGQPLSAEVGAQIKAANSIGINVLAYATNRELKSKEDFFVPAKPQGSKDDFPRGMLYIAKLRHSGGCDTAPAALPHLLEAAQRELGIRVNTEQRLIDLTDPNLFRYHLVFMHGRHNFSFTPKEREQLRLFIQRGGTLMADSICANEEFTAAFRREMLAVFADDPEVTSKDHPLAPIPAKDPLFHPERGGYNLSQVSLREPQTVGANDRATVSIRKIEPDLEGVKIGDRYGVIFSKYDLSCALEKHDSLECKGYTREDAERIGLNILLYTLHQ